MRALIVTAGVLALSAGAARAATVITMTQGGDGESDTQTIYLDSDRLRISSPHGDMLFRGDQGKVFMIDAKSRSYSEMSPESMQKMKAQMDSAMARMKQQMASMPEAQRKQIEAMMASRGAPGMGQAPSAPPQITYEKAGAPRKVGQWECAPYNVVFNGKPDTELCLAKLSDLGLTRDDLKPFIGLSTLMGKQVAQMGHQGSPMASADFDSLKKVVGYDGFPVQTTHRSPGGKPDFQSTMQSITHKDAPAGFFDIPAGYKKREMGGPGGPGGDSDGGGGD